MNRLVSSFILITSLLTAGTALASDDDIMATTAPASVCSPIDSTQASRVRLSNGAWVFRGNSTGTVTFYCPVDFNANTVSNQSNDNDISAFRVYYRDSDGNSSSTRITARLTYRRSDGMYSAGSLWDSNGVTSTTGNTVRMHLNSHDVRFGALYAFVVTMRRTSTSQSPAFSGIDFTFPPVP